MNHNLVEYLRENLHGILCEDKEADKYGDGIFTKFQEVFTCLLFDIYFNRNNKFNTPEELKEYVVNNVFNNDLVKQIDKLCTGFCNFEADVNKVFTDDSKTGRDWVNSFFYQCKSFENFLNQHSYLSSENIAFLHHDTKLSIKNGKLFNSDWKTLSDRVELGTKKFGFSKKDNYQKADIYAVWDDADKTDPSTDIEIEKLYWTVSGKGENCDGDLFIGISLKKLDKVIANPRIMNLEDSEDKFDLINPIFDFNPFVVDKKGKPVKFNNEDDFTSGRITANFEFGLIVNDHKKKINLTICSDSVGITRDDSAEKNHLLKWVKDKNKGLIPIPHPATDFLNPHVKIEFTGGALSRLGRAKSVLDKELNKDERTYLWKYDSSYLKREINRLKQRCAEYGIETTLPNSIPADVIKIIDYLSEKQNDIVDLFKAWDDNRKTNTIESPDYKKVLMYAKAAKWKGVIDRQIGLFDRLLDYVDNIQEKLEKEGIPVESKQVALKLAFVQLFNIASKAVLPFLYLQEG